MGQIIIFRNGVEHLSLFERNTRNIQTGSVTKTMLSDDSVSLVVNTASILDIKVNDYFILYGETYRINALPTIQKNSNSSYQYSIKAEGLMYDLLRCKFFNADGTGWKSELSFPLIGTLDVFLTVIVSNMTRFSDLWDFAPTLVRSGGGIGEVGTGSGTRDETPEPITKSITFGNDSCLSALQKICQEFKTDFWIKTELGSFVIHTGAFGNTLPVVFEYGKGNGLYNLNRSNVNDDGMINRLYVTGGTENLPNEYRSFSTNLKFSDIGYIEDTGLIASMGLKEGSLELPEIYPHRTGSISALGSTKFKFIDASMDFDLNEKEVDGITTKYLKADTTAKIHFNTGNLAGYQFEIKKGGYNNLTKEFEIIGIKTSSDQKIPDITAEAFQFAVGDEYVLLDIFAPESYITKAETELLAKADEQFLLKKQAQVSYSLNVDPLFLKELATPMNIGDYIRVQDSAMGVDKVIRINSITRNFIQNGEEFPYDYKMEIADTYEIDYASQIILEVQEIISINKIYNGGRLNNSLVGLKTTRELQSMTFDTDGYFDPVNIRPNSIETNMLSVGAQSQQLSLSVIFRVNADGFPNKVVSEVGKLFSQTYNRTWDIPAATNTIPDNNARYIYGKVRKEFGLTIGSILYSTEKITFDSDPNYYHFLLGILHTIVEGYRVLSLTYGTTTINGGLIRTGTISSMDGETFFNMDIGKIGGRIEIGASSSGYNNLDDIPDLSLLDDLVNDNKLTPNEKQIIQLELNVIFAEKPIVVSQATTYSVSTTDYVTKYNDLMNYTSPLFVDPTVTSVIDGLVFRNKFSQYYTAKITVQKAITTKIKSDLNDIQSDIDDVSNALNDFSNDVNEFFSDGLITVAEAAAIEKYINTLNTEKGDIENRYNQTIANPNLVAGTVKTDLITYYSYYVDQHINLIDAIIDAISDGATTIAEKSYVDVMFENYRTSLVGLTTQFELAFKEIAKNEIDAITIGGRNLFKESATLGAAYIYGVSADRTLIDEPTVLSKKIWKLTSIVRTIDDLVFFFPTLSYPDQFSANIGDQVILSFFIKTNVAQRLSTTFSPHTINVETTWTKIVIPYAFFKNANAHFYLAGAGLTTVEIHSIKLEKGTKATDWTPAPEDLDASIGQANTNSANALLQALNAQNTANAAAAVNDFWLTTIDGNVISTGTLQVGDVVDGANAFITGVTDRPGGESVRFAAGKSYADKYLSPFQVLQNGLVRFVNPTTGQKTFELGYNATTGKVVFDIYNDDNVKIATIGASGIQFTGYIRESYTETNFRKLTTGTFTKSAIQTEILNQIQKAFLDGQNSPTYLIWSQWNISVIENYTAYLYDEGRNFESADNAQYAGYYPTENKFDTPIPNGIYVVDTIQQQTVGTRSGTVYPRTFIYYTQAYQMLDGKVVDMLSVSVTKKISGTDWDTV